MLAYVASCRGLLANLTGLHAACHCRKKILVKSSLFTTVYVYQSRRGVPYSKFEAQFNAMILSLVPEFGSDRHRLENDYLGRLAGTTTKQIKSYNPKY